MMALLTFLVICYTVLILLAMRGWQKLPEGTLLPSHQPETRISVLVPVRNEANEIEALLTDLEEQSYPKELFEVLVIDDHSEDDTAQLVEQFARSTDLNLQLVGLKNGRGEGKKSAISFGVAQASGTLIVQTDGDCRVQPNWLSLLEFHYRTTGAKFISGPVCLTAGGGFFEKMQGVEFAALIGTGAAAIASKQPNMCNGANLAYEKQVFGEVNGFQGNEQLASGDDEFLMHKIQAQFPGKVTFLKSFGAIVFTKAAPTFSQFIAQRVRWASKWRFYRSLAPKLVALLVFGVNAGLLLALGLWLGGKISGSYFWSLLIAKSGVDFVFLALVLGFFRRTKYLIYTLPLQLVYAPYVVYCALAGLTGSYRWKGRMHKSL